MKSDFFTLNASEINIENIDIIELKNLKEGFKALEDSRNKNYITYKLWDIVIVSFLAVLSNANDWEGIHNFAVEKYKWLRSFLLLTGGIPSVQTYENVIGMLDPIELTRICNDFVLKVTTKINEPDIISIDGKQDTSSSRTDNYDSSNSKKNLNVLNAYSNNYGITLASLPIESKTNEIPTTKIILKYFNVKGNIITFDALNTQKDNIKEIIKRKGDYVVALKNNHGDFYEKLITYFDDNILLKAIKEKCYLKEVSKENSCVITREYFQTCDIDWLSDKDDWKGLKSIGCIIKSILKPNGELVVEKRYYISSLNDDINLFSKAIRKHWGVENKLHWQLDFTFKCDDNTTSNHSALLNLQILKKLALATLNIAKPEYNCSLKSIREKIALNTEKHLENIFKIIAKKKV